MEFSQEQVTTLHDLTGDAPLAVDDALAETAVVVPMTDREHGTLAAERVLSALERVGPAVVNVPVRAPSGRIGTIRDWLETFDLPLEVLWCNAPAVDDLLAEAGLADGFGKGRDVWLALGPAAEHCSYVVVHDADASSYDGELVERLLAPLAMGYEFSKGYYARVENGRLYGRLCRLFVEPLVSALAADHDEPIVSYLGAFRYALAGEFAMTADLARQLRAPRSWGLEVGTLGDAFGHASFAGTAQVDLGRHEHDHRAVAGETGLEGMADEVGSALFRVLDDHGVRPDYDRLADRYGEIGHELVDQYGADARFNGLVYDADAERDQLARYASAIAPPGPDRRLPPWESVDLSPESVVAAATPWRES